MRVLMVEGDHRLATSLRRALSEWGMSVHVAHDGEEGLAAALRDEFDVIVLDMVLPLLGGDAVARGLRDQRVHTPILMLTALDAIGGSEADADDFLVKPFSQRELVARIRALSRHQGPDRRAKLRAGEIVLDTAARAVRVGDVTVELTSNEFSILEYLMLNRGRVLTKAQILDHVWRYDFDGGRNLVEVYVGRLRRKLTDAGAADPLVTVRGVGYRFDVPD
jgi:two-component system, OmpR family, response regulator